LLTGISSNSGVSLGAGNGGASSLKRGTDDARGSASSGEVAIVSAGDVDSGAAVEGVSWSKGSQRRVDLYKYIQIVLGLINQHAVERFNWIWERSLLHKYFALHIRSKCKKNF